MSVVYTHPAEARRRFIEYATGEITNENLAHGALLIALEDYPQLDISANIGALNNLALRVMKRSSASEPPIFRLGHLHAEMFDVDGYSGDDSNYYDPRNAYLNEVIERRVGLPLTLSIIFLHVANRVGLNASGVGLPGHFLVKVQFELNEVYVDAFHGGTTLTVGEIAGLLSEMSGGRMRLTGDHLRSFTGRETVQRLLANLQSMWTKAGDTRKAVAAAERMRLLIE